MNCQIDFYQPAKDIYAAIASACHRNKEKNRVKRIRQNIASLSPAIHSKGWSFRFVMEEGESLNVIDDNRFINDASYAKDLLNFTATMQLPKEDANPSVIQANDVYNSHSESLEDFSSKLLVQAKEVFKALKISKRGLHAVFRKFRSENAMKSATQILEHYPNIDPRRYNRFRWSFCEGALLGTITNWLGDRVTLTRRDLNRLWHNIGSPCFSFRKNPLSDNKKMFVYEFSLVVLHALDTVDFLQDTMHCKEVINANHAGYVFHDNSYIASSLPTLQQVNDLSYTVLLPLFFTKELYVHRSKVLVKLRRELLLHREAQMRILSGDIIRDSRRMRSTNREDALEVREVAEIVCLSDLLGNAEDHMIQFYGEFPRFEEHEVCGMPRGGQRLFTPSTVNYKADHILNNVGNRLRRTALDKCLKANNDNIILAAGDVLATHALARQAVVYTNDPAWGSELVGGVEQPIMGGFQSNRHRLLAYLGLFHLLSDGEGEEAQMQEFLLRKSYSTDSDLLKAHVMEFVERKIIERKSRGQDIRVSEVVTSAKFASGNSVDSAVIVREMVHYLVADKGNLVPTAEGEENDGCYFTALYNQRKHGNAKLLVNVTIPLAGVSTTQGNMFQLYTREGRVLTSSVDLSSRSAEVVHLVEEGDLRYRDYYPVLVTGDLFVG